jgi:hypothetical protein
LQTAHGNILWDIVTLLDDEAVEKVSIYLSISLQITCDLSLMLFCLQIREAGGITAIVISHPHYYTTYVEWATVFKCPVYFSPEDETWINRTDITSIDRRMLNQTRETILPGITAIKCGGHFPGSLLLHWNVKGGVLFLADSIVTVPVGQQTSAVLQSVPLSFPKFARLHQNTQHQIAK